jgi:acyl-CoA synthetase (AMP-forming)/AMP-acid ligase II
MAPATAVGPGVPPGQVDNLSELLVKHVQERPERIAVGTSDLQLVLGYRQLNELVRSASAQLSQLGVRRGDVIALISDNNVEFVVALFAIVGSGAIVVPLNPALTPPELRVRFSALPVRALLVPQHLAARIDPWGTMANCARRWIIGVDGSGESATVRVTSANGQTIESVADAPGSFPFTIDAGVALVMFTSGSTSAPKAVPLTHRNVAESIHGITTVYDLSPQDATLVVMPLFHGHGLVAGLLSTLASGGGAYLPATGSFSAHRFWPDMARVGATWYTAVPTIHRILVNRADQEYPRSSPVALRFIRSCSAPLDIELATAANNAFHAPMIAAYGMTETSHQATSNPLPNHRSNKAGSVGLPAGLDLRIAIGDRLDAAIDEVGEICVRGPALTSGYLNNPGANADSFVDGWFRTGDLGSLDREGYLFIKGRLKEIINRGGEKIAPSDIDTVLLSNPKVFEAASFGEPDAIYGEAVQAAVIVRPGMQATEDELRDYCRSALVDYEVPERIHIVTDFPRTAKGSVDRNALAGRFATT